MGDFNDLGGVSILGFISPFNTGDTYPVIDPLYGIDGFRNVNTISELNAIPNARRRAGMIVGVSGGTEYYKLNSSPWSGNLFDWTLIYLTNSPITGFTYNGNDNTFTLIDGYGVSLNAYLDSVSGLTSTGVISSNTLSATTYLNLPLDIFVTGGTYNNNLGRATFVNNTGGTFNVTGFTTGSTDTFSTGLTYSNNILTISRNQGQPNLSTTINSFTGITVNGNSQLNGQISSTNLSGSTDRLLQVSSGGTFTATTQVIPAYITSGATVANLLDDTNNWDINGNYTGTTITNTFQGQKHYNPSYFFEAVNDNLWIRLIRG